MTLTMVCKIVFPANERRDEIVLHKCSSIEFESTWKELTSRGELTLPRLLRYFNRKKIQDSFSRGDEIMIYFGYNNILVEEFRGYITEVSADIPLSLKFEDEMFKVRTLPVNFSSASITLEQLLKTIVPGYEIDALEGVEMGAVRLAKTQVGPVLEKIQSEWGLYSYMKGKTLVCGKYYADDESNSIASFHLERNCVSTSLNYRRKEDLLIQFIYTSGTSKGDKIEAIWGDKNPITNISCSFNYIKSQSELLKLAQRDYDKAKVDRFDGEFTAFGIPSVKHGMRADLKSELYDDRNGLYYIEKVVKTFDIGGIRQVITLGEKVK